jgi:RNA recognition motif-containing protein
VNRNRPLFGGSEEVRLKKIYVGNLPYTASENELRDMFARFGTVHAVNLINDRETGRPRGFGFVQMDDKEADAAISALDGQDFGGRTLRVNEARERERGGGGGGGRDRERRSW